MIKIVEVGPRDGLQNESHPWTIEDRIDFINLLSECGFSEIEVGSFVSPKWVPQMANTDRVYQHINKKAGILYSCLVPNLQGLDQAVKEGVKSISIFTAASEAFNKKNINCSIEESFQRFEPVMQQARHHNLRVRGYVSCVVECPYSGTISPQEVAYVAERLWKLGCAEISLGDTIGKGTPETISKMIKEVKKLVPAENLAIHCHDTYGTALLNIQAALEEGVHVIDAAMGGLGGCPYAGGQAKGNIATEKVVEMLDQQAFKNSINKYAVQQASAFIMQQRNKKKV